jgi:hypothetical protein
MKAMLHSMIEMEKDLIAQMMTVPHLVQSIRNLNN